MANAKGAIRRLLIVALSSFAQARAKQSEAAKIYAQSSNSVLLIIIKSTDSLVLRLLNTRKA